MAEEEMNRSHKKKNSGDDDEPGFFSKAYDRAKAPATTIALTVAAAQVSSKIADPLFAWMGNKLRRKATSKVEEASANLFSGIDITLY